VSGPALVLVPDADARVDPGRPVLGVAPGLRLADAARRAGFAAVYVLPGTRASPPGASPGSAGDRLDTAALVVLESAAIEPAALLRLIHAGGEGSLFDERGRPVAWWSARLARLPAALPVTEALASPDAPSPAEVARLVDAGDRPRMEALIVRATAAEGPGRTADPAPPSPWRRWLELPLLRWLCARRWPPGQIEVVALLLAALAGAAALLPSGLGLVLAAALLLVGVQVAALLPELRRLVAAGGGARAGWLTPAIRPSATRRWRRADLSTRGRAVGRTGVADLVLLCSAAAAALLSLAQARAVLRRPSAVPFELPSVEGLAAQLEVPLPAWLRTPVRAEILVFLLAWVGPGVALGGARGGRSGAAVAMVHRPP
jgi:hypothetical protein